MGRPIFKTPVIERNDTACSEEKYRLEARTFDFSIVGLGLEPGDFFNKIIEDES